MGPMELLRFSAPAATLCLELTEGLAVGRVERLPRNTGQMQEHGPVQDTRIETHPASGKDL